MSFKRPSPKPHVNRTGSVLALPAEALLDYHGAGDHFHCTVEPSPGHIQCRLSASEYFLSFFFGFSLFFFLFFFLVFFCFFLVFFWFFFGVFVVFLVFVVFFCFI